MSQPFWCQGTRIAVVHGADAPAAERIVADTAARSIRERTVESRAFAADDPALDSASWDLVLHVGTPDGYPSLAEQFIEHDRLRPASPLTAGSESSRGFTYAGDNGMPGAAVLGDDVVGLWLGTGRFLRHLMWLNAEFACAEWSDDFRPSMRLRGEVLSSHDVSNTYMNWSIEQWERYIQDMALWGMNLFVTIPVHYAHWLGMDPWGDPPVYASDEQRAKFEGHWATQARVSEIVRDMGLQYGVWIPANDPAMAQHRPEWDRGWREYVCPSMPEARDAILRSREGFLSRLPHLDILFVPSADDGGCWCSDCVPWSETYVDLVREQHEIARRYHPNVRAMLSNQALTHAENAELCEGLRSLDDTSWIAGVAWAPGSNELFRHARLTEEWRWAEWPGFGDEVASVQWFRRNLPPGVDLYLYPDITHSLRCQYPIWEIEPVVGHAYHRDPVFFRPDAYHDLYQRTGPFCDGSFPYSEGMYDNLNQVVWLELANNPGRSARDIVLDYWRWYVGDAAAPFAAAATDSLEDAWRQDFRETNRIDRAVRDSFEVTQHLPRGRDRGNWRADILRLRTLMDQWLRSRLDAAARVEETVADRLQLDDGESRGALAEAARMARTGIADLGDAPADPEIPRLARAVRAEGLDIPAVERIGGITGNLRWLANLLEHTATNGDVETIRSARLDAIDYERGVAYVDCGHPRRDRNRLNGRPFITLDDADPDARPSQIALAMSYGDDEPLAFRFTGLNPDVPYDVYVTYFIPDYLLRWCHSGEQRMEASGVEVHGDLELPRGTPRRYSFALPSESYRAGETVLRFIPTGASQAAMVSEIWVRERSG